jgi:hypothetical protein
MIYELVRRDPAWKVIPAATLTVAAAGAILGLDIAMLFVPVNYFAVVNLVWPFQRAMPFQAALPIRARDLYLARIAALLSMIWLPVAAGSAAAFLRHGAATPTQALGVLAAGLYFSFLVIRILSVRVEQCGGWSWTSGVLWVSALFAGVFVFSRAVAAPAAVVGAIACAAQFFWAWRRIPAGFQAAPYEAILEEPAPRRRPFAWRPVLTSMFSWWYVLFAALGMFIAWFADEPLVLASMLTPAYGLTRRRLRWLPGVGLPLSPYRLMACLLLPLIVIIILLYAPLRISGHAADMKRVPEISSERYFEPPSWNVVVTIVPQPKDDPTSLNVTTPFEYWRLAFGGAPVIRAPWGESVHPTELRVGPAAIYNPFTVDRGNTRRFQSWQWDRAAVAAYGRPVSPCCTTAVPITAQPPAEVLSLASLLAYTLLIAWAFEIGDATIFRRTRRVVFETVLIMLLTWLPIFADAFGIPSSYGSITGALFKKYLVTVCSALPMPGVIGVSLLLVLIPFGMLLLRWPKREIFGPIRQDNSWDY